MNNYIPCPNFGDCVIDNCKGLYRLKGRRAIALYSNGEDECNIINVVSPEEAKEKELEGMLK